MKRWFRYSLMSLMTGFGVVLLWLITATPGQAHWADMAAAEIVVGETAVQMTLTFPTGLVAFADRNQDGQLGSTEVQTHRDELQTFLSQNIELRDRDNRKGALQIQPQGSFTLPDGIQVAPDTHTTLRLNYTWLQPLQGITIHYNLFLPGVNTAHCLATILQSGHLQTFVFTPTRRVLALTPGMFGETTGILAIAAAFLWGALHSLSPGHGKTMVGAYLIGQRATPKHALLLALITTITHTLGIFALGLITLFAAQYILPQQLYPWMSLVSGLLVMAIGANLLFKRLHRPSFPSSHHHSHDHSHDHSHNHSHDHFHNHHHDHFHDHFHDHSHHYEKVPLHLPHPSHLPHPTTNDAPITWRGLLALGISGGLMPCPAALVLLLGAIALNQISMGLMLVLSFSLGLASVLAGLGLALIYTKGLFERIPNRPRVIRLLPTMSAVCITLIGVGMSTQAVVAVMGNNQ